MGKTVEVSTETWKKLMTIRTSYELSSMDEVVKKLLAKAALSEGGEIVSCRRRSSPSSLSSS